MPVSAMPAPVSCQTSPHADERVAHAHAPVVAVWDLPTRLFHWLLVVLVVCAWVSFKFGDARMKWHEWNRYGVLVLVTFRILWGVVGSSTARFAGFVRGPGAVLAYARGFAGGNGRRFLGHNPLGGMMVVGLLLALGVHGAAGLFATDDVMVDGPLRHTVSTATAARLTSLHRAGLWALAALVSAHITAVLTYLLWKRENLIRPMLSGVKPRAGHEGEPAPVLRSSKRAVAVLTLAAVLVWGGLQLWPHVAALSPDKPVPKDDW
jgi:cytochrome b